MADENIVEDDDDGEWTEVEVSEQPEESLPEDVTVVQEPEEITEPEEAQEEGASRLGH